MMQPRLDQIHIKEQLHIFLTSIKKEVVNQIQYEKRKPIVNHKAVKLLQLEIDNTTDAIDSLQEGHCSGFSSLWLYCTYLTTTPIRFDDQLNPIPGDDLPWFNQTLVSISSWDGVSQLTIEQKNEFFRFISLLRFFQDPDENLRIPQGTLSETLQDTRGRKFNQEYSIAAHFTEKEIKHLIIKIVHEERLILISSHNHDMGLIKLSDTYYFYDPNNQTGALRYDNSEQLSSAIFTASDFISGRSSPLGFRIFCEEAIEATAKIWPVNYPLQKKIIKTLSFIKDKKIDLSYIKHKKRTALHTAAFINCNASLEALLDANADPNLADEDQRTALMICAGHNNKIAIEHLIEHKANTEILSDNKNALMFASEHGHTDAAITLIRLGADIKKKPPDAKDVFTLAEKNGYKECAEEMKKAVKNLVKTDRARDVTVSLKQQKLLPQQTTKYDCATNIDNHQTSHLPSVWNIFSIFSCCRRKKKSAIFDEETLLADEKYKIV